MTGTEPILGNWPAVRLVAGRELSTRLRTRSYRITTAILAILIIALCVIMKLVSGSSSGYEVGFTGATQPLASPLHQVAAALGQTVTDHTATSQADGEAQLRSGKLDALIIPDAKSTSGFSVEVKKDIDANLRTALNVLAGQIALDEQIVKLHGNPATVRAAEAEATATVHPLQAPYPYQTQQLVLGIVAGVLIYLSLMINGQMVAQGVVEEKTSRVVELLLSTVRPWQLMAGKVLGIGTVGLIQMLVIGVCGIVAGLATGVLTVSVTAAVGTVIWLIVWYLLGFFMYAIVFAALGALVSRQEEVGSVVSPAMILVIAGYVVGISVLPSDPSSSLAEVMSVIPVFAPTLMPMRLAMGGVPAWEAIVSVGLVIILIPALVWLAARIYRNAVLRSGARVKLSQALRAA
ncbi:MAG TPA: ABC transporter permease [Pseudonocardiaceae bacterium]|jgi:ABC-2 type transport system permease protein|nr:ABC transporter permease [Pseudonocardiaceae bacterium]